MSRPFFGILMIFNAQMLTTKDTNEVVILLCLSMSNPNLNVLFLIKHIVFISI